MKFVDELNAIDPEEYKERERIRNEDNTVKSIINYIKSWSRALTLSGGEHLIEGYWCKAGAEHSPYFTPQDFAADRFSDRVWNIDRLRQKIEHEISALGFNQFTVEMVLKNANILNCRTRSEKLKASLKRAEYVYLIYVNIRW